MEQLRANQASDDTLRAATLPRYLADPLLLYRQYLGGIIVLNIVYIILFIQLLIITLLDNHRFILFDKKSINWISIPYFIAYQMENEYFLIFGYLFVIITVGLPAIACVWRILPRQPVNAFFLRSFRYDHITWSLRKSAQIALGDEFRLSGIRDPGRRWPRVIRHLGNILFVVRYSSAKYMNLEAGQDWKARLWRSLGNARCALIDLSDLTSFVKDEIELCYHCLGLQRILFIGDATLSIDDWRTQIAGILGKPADDPDIRLAIWGDTREKKDAFIRKVHMFGVSLPPGIAGLKMDTLRFAQIPGVIPAEGLFAWGGWGWIELVLGILLGSLISYGWDFIQPSGSIFSYLWKIPTFSLLFAQVAALMFYVFECISFRERFLATVSFLFAFLWPACCIGVALILIHNFRIDLIRLHSSNNLKEIGRGILNYSSTYGDKLPPAEILGPAKPPGDLRPWVSWRVLILPYVEQNELYRQYRLDEPWDGPNNIQLVAKMPKIYAMPGKDSATLQGETYYRVFINPRGTPSTAARTAFERSVIVRNGDWTPGGGLASFIDGTSKTLLVVEAAEAVPWTKPDELIFDPSSPLPPLGGHFPRGFNVVFADGHVRLLPQKTDEPTVRALITRNGGEKVDLED